MDNDVKDKKEQRRQYILTAPLMPLLVKMAVPTVIGMLVMILYNLTDTFFIAMLGNKSMTAAIGIAFSFISVIQAIGFWLGYGSGNAMSRSLGEGKYNEAESFASMAAVTAVFIGVILAVISSIFLSPLSLFIGGAASDNLYIFTKEYLKVIVISIPFMLFSLVIYNQLRLCGNVGDGMKGLLSGMIVNIVLDPVFMFGLKMGFIGAAYATLTGQIIGSLVLFRLIRKNGNIPISFKKVKFTKDNIYHILIGGLPNFARQGITSLSMVLLNIAASGFGEDVVAAITVSSRISAVAYMIVIGWGQGFQPVCAMNYGAKQYDRVRLAMKIFSIGGLVLAAIFWIPSLLLSSQILSLFGVEANIIAQGVGNFRLFYSVFILYGVMVMTVTFFQSIGNGKKAGIIVMMRQLFLFVPAMILLPMVFGVKAVWFTQPLVDFTMIVIGIAMMINELKNMEQTKTDTK